MKRTWNSLGGGVFALSIAGALTFGATQVLAAPAVNRPPGCDKYECIDYCSQTSRKGTCRPYGDLGFYYCYCF